MNMSSKQKVKESPDLWEVLDKLSDIESDLHTKLDMIRQEVNDIKEKLE